MAGRLAAGLFAGGGFYGLMYLLLGSAISALVLLAIVAVAVGVFLLLKLWVRRAEQQQGRRMEAQLLKGMSKSEGGGLDESPEEQDVRKRLEKRWSDVYQTLRERRYDYYTSPWYLIRSRTRSSRSATSPSWTTEAPVDATGSSRTRPS
jgi:hypothetical protein